MGNFLNMIILSESTTGYIIREYNNNKINIMYTGLQTSIVVHSGLAHHGSEQPKLP